MQVIQTLNDGSRLEVVVNKYADRVLILITQLGKVGNLIQATIPDTTSLPAMTDTDLPEPPAAIQLTPLLGGSASEHLHSLHSIYASHAATILWSIESARAEGAPRRPVIVGIALRKLGDEGSDMERTTFRSAMSLLRGVLDRE